MWETCTQYFYDHVSEPKDIFKGMRSHIEVFNCELFTGNYEERYQNR